MEKILEASYELYRLDWMLSHGLTLTDLSKAMAEKLGSSDRQEMCPAEAFKDAVDEFFQTGFDGMLWACIDEFEECEFQDESYITELLSHRPELLQDYLAVRIC